MKRVLGFLSSFLCSLLLISLLLSPQTKIQHQDSSAFEWALDRAVARLEFGGRLILAGTATPVAAAAQQVTYDGRYTCDTYEAALLTCDAGSPGCVEHTADPQGHTCVDGAYTCEFVTCDTYDMQTATCDPFNPACGPIPPPPHTFEPSPYNHTCEGHTCDGTFTCDFTLDPRGFTCDAADPQCQEATFDAFHTTCDPMSPLCRTNNPKGYCTAQTYPTCTPGTTTCDPVDPLCSTIDPYDPQCMTPTKKTTWGKLKASYSE